MFNHARDLVINGGNFSVANSYGSSNLKGVDLLRDRSALGCLADSSDRDYYTRRPLQRGTRSIILQDIIDWVNKGNLAPLLMWLHGPAGAGKSAIAQEIADYFREKGLLIGSFFFSRTASEESSDGDRLIPTLVLELIRVIPLLRAHVEKAIADDPAIFERTRHRQMETLFVEPIRSLSNVVDRTKSKRFLSSTLSSKDTDLDTSLLPRLVVVDGLDECRDATVQEDILLFISSCFSSLSFPIRFFVTSRPESHILSLFQHNSTLLATNYHTINLDQDPEAEADILRFALHELQEIRRTHPLRESLDPSWPSNSVLNTLVSKSSGQFIYISTAIKYVQDPDGFPDERLNTITKMSSTANQDEPPLALLDHLYSFLLERVHQKYRPILVRFFGVIYLAQTDGRIAYKIGRSIAEIEDTLVLRPGQLSIILRPIVSLVHLPADRTAQPRLYHASLDDYLQAERAGDFFMELSYAYEVLAIHWMKRLTGSLNNPVEICSAFLAACQTARWPDELRTYLKTFPFFYDVVLDRPNIWRVTELVFQFLDLFTRRNFRAESLSLHKYHSDRIKEKLIQRHELTPTPCDKIFENPNEQNCHELYSVIMTRINILSFLLPVSNSPRPHHPGGFQLSKIYRKRDAQKRVMVMHALIVILRNNEKVSSKTIRKLQWFFGYSYFPREELSDVVVKCLSEYMVQPGRETEESERIRHFRDRYSPRPERE